jgi:hypothetical protein
VRVATNAGQSQFDAGSEQNEAALAQPSFLNPADGALIGVGFERLPLLLFIYYYLFVATVY